MHKKTNVKLLSFFTSITMNETNVSSPSKQLQTFLVNSEVKKSENIWSFLTAANINNNDFACLIKSRFLLGIETKNNSWKSERDFLVKVNAVETSKKIVIVDLIFLLTIF